MIRSWAVRPDASGIVTREMLIEAFVDAATMLDIAGGALQVVVGRTKTGVPNEMVMNGVVLEWRDRTDAKAQPEVAASVTPPEPEPQPEPIQALQEEANEIREVSAAEMERALDGDRVISPDDGFDFTKLEDEDVEEPAVTR